MTAAPRSDRRGPAALGLGAAGLAIALVVLIVLSSRQESLGAGLGAIVGRLWGVTTLVDLYAGLFVVSLWIAHLERRVSRWLPWTIALMLTGNLATMVYIVLRARKASSTRQLLLTPTAELGRPAEG